MCIVSMLNCQLTSGNILDRPRDRYLFKPNSEDFDEILYVAGSGIFLCVLRGRNSGPIPNGM